MQLEIEPMRDTMELRQLVEKVTSLPGYTSTIGTQVLSVEAGKVEMALDRRAELLQFNGYFHGGVIAGLADHAAGGAVTTALPAGRIAITVDLHVNFLAPADGEQLVAAARCIKTGSAIGTAQIEIFSQSGEDRQLCAIATATMRVVDMAAMQSAG